MKTVETSLNQFAEGIGGETAVVARCYLAKNLSKRQPNFFELFIRFRFLLMKISFWGINTDQLCAFFAKVISSYNIFRND